MKRKKIRALPAVGKVLLRVRCRWPLSVGSSGGSLSLGCLLVELTPGMLGCAPLGSDSELVCFLWNFTQHGP